MRRHAVWVIGALFLAMQAGPLLHLLTHRDDHTHGPTPVQPRLARSSAPHLAGDSPRDDRSTRALADPHAVAHARGLIHSHGREASTPTEARPSPWHEAYGYSRPGLVRRVLSGLASAVVASDTDVGDETSDAATPHSHDESPAPSHGDGSAAHFGLALIEPPPTAPLLPSEAVEADVPMAVGSAARSCPARRHAPRGPPSPHTSIRVC